MKFNPTEWRRFEGSAPLKGLLVGTDSISPWTTRAEHNKRLGEEQGLVASLSSRQAFAIQNAVKGTQAQIDYFIGEHLRMLFDVQKLSQSSGLEVIAYTGEVGTELGYHSINPEDTKKYVLRKAYTGMNVQDSLSKKFILDMFGRELTKDMVTRMREGVWPVARGDDGGVDGRWCLYSNFKYVYHASRWVGSEKSFVSQFGEDAVARVPTIYSAPHNPQAASQQKTQ